MIDLSTYRSVPPPSEYRTPKALELVEEYHARKTRWTGLQNRIRAIDLLNSGSWGRVFPEDVTEQDLPMVENLFRLAIEDGGRLFAAALPTERVDAADLKDPKAEVRERVLNGYTYGSNLDDVMELFGQDFPAAGFTAIKTWPRQDPRSGEWFPRFSRIDPRNVLPEPRWAPDRPTDAVLVSYTETVRRLKREFPEQMEYLLPRIRTAVDRFRGGIVRPGTPGYDRDGMPTELEVLDFYASDYVCRTVLYHDRDARLDEFAMLVEMTNETGLCPVQLAFRPSWAREPMGQLDDAKGIVRAENRFFRILADYFVQMVYGGKIFWNVKNPTEKRPGVPYLALGPDAFAKPVTPEIPAFQAFQVTQQLNDAARSDMVAPRSREGEVDLNKASASFLSRAQGQLNDVTRSNQKQWDAAKKRANEVAFAQDESYLNTEKTVTGIARGKRFATTYTPKDAIDGDYQNRVTHGTASGLDPATHQVMQLQKRGSGDLSQETFLEQDPGIEDAQAEISKIEGEQFKASVLAGLLLPTTPLDQRVLAMKLRMEGKTIEEIASALMEAAAPEATPPIPGIPGTGAPAPEAQGTNAFAPSGAAAERPPLPPAQALQSVRR